MIWGYHYFRKPPYRNTTSLSRSSGSLLGIKCDFCRMWKTENQMASMGEFVHNTNRNEGFEHQSFQGPEGWLNAIIPPGWNRETGSNSWYQQNQAPLIADFFVGRGSCIQAAESGEDPGTGGTSAYWWCSPHKKCWVFQWPNLSVSGVGKILGETKLRSELFWNLKFWSFALLRLQFAWKLLMFINGWSVRKIFPSNQWLEAQSIGKIECPRRKPGKSDPKLSASECFKMMSWSTMERSRLISTFLP